MTELIHVKHLEECLPHSRCSMSSRCYASGQEPPGPSRWTRRQMRAQTGAGAEREAGLESRKVTPLGILLLPYSPWRAAHPQKQAPGVKPRWLTVPPHPLAREGARQLPPRPCPRQRGQPWGKERGLPSPGTGRLLSPGRAPLGPACSPLRLPPPSS